MKLSRPAVAAVVLLVALLFSVPTTAGAATKAKARSVNVLTAAGSWGVVSSPVGGAPVIGEPFTASKSGLSSLSQDFDVINTGTMPLTGHTFQIKTSVSGIVPKNPELTLVVCPTGGWKGGKCAGGQVSLGSSTSGNFTSDVRLAPGKRYSVNVSSPLYWGNLNATINVSVSQDHVREPILTNN